MISSSIIIFEIWRLAIISVRRFNGGGLLERNVGSCHPPINLSIYYNTTYMGVTFTAVHDPNVAFSRAPSPALLPAAPSRPRAMNISDTSVTLAWNRPGQGTDDTMGAMGAMGGSFHRVKAYTIEYFSADLKSGWVTVANRIGPTELYTVTSLKPDTRYVFLIRAENALGTGKPSELSKVIKTVGSRTASAPDHYLSRARTQLSITEVSQFHRQLTHI